MRPCVEVSKHRSFTSNTTEHRRTRETCGFSHKQRKTNNNTIILFVPGGHTQKWSHGVGSWMYFRPVDLTKCGLKIMLPVAIFVNHEIF